MFKITIFKTLNDTGVKTKNTRGPEGPLYGCLVNFVLIKKG